MPNYAKYLREQYDNNKITADTFISEVLSEADKRARGEHIVKMARLALLDLGAKGQWVKGKDIFDKCKFKEYENTTNHGLWPWNEKNAKVIKKRGKGSDREYKIEEEFYDILKKVTNKFRYVKKC